MIKNKICLAVFVTLITFGILVINLVCVQKATDKLPNITQLNYNQKSNNKAKTISDIEKIFDKISNKGISFCSELSEKNFKEKSITPVLTNQNYFANYNVELKGRGITAENIQNGEKVAVIDSVMAVEIFFTTEALDKKIYIDGDEFTVCGVYECDKNLINQLSSDGKQRVYIPYTSYKDYSECEVSTISYNNIAYTAAFIEQMNLEQYHSTNFYEKSRNLLNFKHIILAYIFILFCIVTLMIWYRLCRRKYKIIKQSLKDSYLSESIRLQPKKYFLFCIVFIGIPAILFGIFIISDFSIFIPAKYIPDDNIFDISYYITLIIENANLNNTLNLLGDTHLINYYTRMYNCLAWSTIIVALFFTIWIYLFWDAVLKVFKKNKLVT